MTSQLKQFVDLCTKVGISNDYFISHCYEYYDAPTELKSIDNAYSCFYSEFKTFLGKNECISQEDCIEIEQRILKKLIDNRIYDYLKNLMFSDIGILTTYADTHILQLNHDYNFGSHGQSQNAELYDNWNACLIVLNLFRNLKIQKYMKQFDFIIKSKTELLENIDYIIEEKEESKLAKKFYRVQLSMIK